MTVIGAFISRNEALDALKRGERVRFHWQGQMVEVTPNTSLDDLRWELKAGLKLLVRDVTDGQYSII